jgi:mono/diheme cytochrome c family protein
MSLACSGCEKRQDEGLPQGARSAEARLRGRALYREHCAICHGADADGHGARRTGLVGTPVSFRSKQWRSQARPAGVFATIRHGVPQRSMPAWPSFRDDEVWSLVGYVLSVSEEGP